MGFPETGVTGRIESPDTSPGNQTYVSGRSVSTFNHGAISSILELILETKQVLKVMRLSLYTCIKVRDIILDHINIINPNSIMNSYNSTKPLNNPMQKMNKCIFINDKQTVNKHKEK